MSAHAKLVVEAVIDPGEEPWLLSMADQLSLSLSQATEGEPWPILLKFMPWETEGAIGAGASAIVVSLLSAVRRSDQPFLQTEAACRATVQRSCASGAPVFVCTVFRDVQDRPRDGTTSPVMEQIRRLNLMAVEISHEMGVAVIDLDRVFAHVGGRALRTDYRLSGVHATEVAGHTGAWSLLSFGLDDVIDPSIQEKAKEALGDLRGMDAVLTRRLARRRALQQARLDAKQG